MSYSYTPHISLLQCKLSYPTTGLAVVTMCVDLASTHLKAYFTSLHYFGRAKRFLGMSEELREIVTLLGVLRRKKHGKVRKYLQYTNYKQRPIPYLSWIRCFTLHPFFWDPNRCFFLFPFLNRNCKKL